MLPFEIWMEEVRRMSKIKVFSNAETKILRDLWMDDCEAIIATVRMDALRNGEDGVEASDDE